MPTMSNVAWMGAMFAMEALAADAIVELMKHGATHFRFYMEIRQQMVRVTDDNEVELTEEDVQIIGEVRGID